MKKIVSGKPVCGLYYKHVMIVNDDSSVVSKWSFKLIADPRVVIYDRHRFIIQATDDIVPASFLPISLLDYVIVWNYDTLQLPCLPVLV